MNNILLEKNLNNLLDTEKINDLAYNGLQVEGKKEIKKIVVAVSISEALIKKAVSNKADAIIVHHGFFWGKPLAIRSYTKNRIKTLLDNNINLYGYHLPLDINQELGNNIGLLKLLEKNKNIKILKKEPFGNYKGTNIGFKILIEELEHNIIKDTLVKELGKELFFIDTDKEKKVKTIAIVSGGASDLLEEAINDNIDLFISGEISEQSQAICLETNTKYLALGHYNSEKIGVQLLAKYLEKKFNLETLFIDIPNPC